jgi:hypothetical protein
MPIEQASQYNHYIGLIRGSYDLLSLYLVILDQSVTLLNARFGWLLSLHLWALSALDLGNYIAFHTKEPITRSEYQRRLKAAREEMAPASELVEILAEDHDGWTHSDLEPQEARTSRW